MPNGSAFAVTPNALLGMRDVWMSLDSQLTLVSTIPSAFPQITEIDVL